MKFCFVYIVSIVGYFVVFSIPSPAQTKLKPLAIFEKQLAKCVWVADRLVNNSKFQSRADRECSAALKLARALPSEYQKERLNAIRNWAYTLFFKGEFEKARENYVEVLELSQRFYEPVSLEVAKSHFDIARASQGIGKVDIALESYILAENILRKMLTSVKTPSEKIEVIKLLKDSLILQRFLARYMGDPASEAEISKKIEELEKPQ